jgi:uncharacterized protein YjiS (DUF1127 family)
MSNRLRFGRANRSAPPCRRTALPFPSWTTIRAAWWRYRTRQRIAELDHHLLKDIGVTFADAEAEANKPFWQE